MDEGQGTTREAASAEAAPASALSVFLAFLHQGFTAFGGPAAHIGHFRREFVERRGWLGEAAFADLLAFCHLVPGPASSQLAMAIGQRRAGFAGLLAALAGFILPAAAAMIGLAYAAPRLEANTGGNWAHGLKIAAAAIVAQALVGMARTLARGPIRAGIAIGAAAGLLITHGPMAQIFALLAGALFGYALLRDDSAAPQSAEFGPPAGPTPRRAVLLLAIGAVLLAGLPFLAALLQSPLLALASIFFRTGALAFGEEHVLLPLLVSEVIGRGWLDRDSFLAGYGVVQALPGPLFSFAAFVGAAQKVAAGGWIGGLAAVTAVLLPSVLLVAGALPFWDRVKRSPEAAAALAGVSAVVVGLLAAALWDPLLLSAVRRPNDWALVAAAYVFLAIARFPPWLVVIGFALATGFLSR